MRVQLGSFLKYISLFTLGIIVVYLLFRQSNQINFFKDVENSQWHWAVLAGFAVLIAHIFRALRWRLMVEPLANHRIPFFSVFNSLMVGYLVNLLLPRVGELTRCSLLSKKEKIATAALIGTVIAERILDILMLLVLIIIAFAIYSKKVLTVFDHLKIADNSADKYLIYGGFIFIIILLLSIYFLFFDKKWALLDKIKRLFYQLKSGLLSLKNLNHPALFFTYTFLIWVFYIISAWIGFSVFLATQHLGFQAAILMVTGSSIGMIVPIQGGIGAYHFMVTECLKFLNVSAISGLEYATLIHASQTLIVIIIGLLSLILGFKFKIPPINGAKASNTST